MSYHKNKKRHAKISTSIILASTIILSGLLMPSFVKAKSSDKKQLKCLSDAIYHEARGEPKKGKKLVAKVILNRVESDEFPDTICGVIYQKGQFTYKKGKAIKEKAAYETATSIAKNTLKTHDPNEDGVLYFLNPKTATNKKWAKKHTVVATVGNHVFLK